MALDEGILHVVEDIYGAAMEPARWPGALDRIADCMAADHAHVFIADSANLARKILVKHDFEVLLAETGEAALQLANEYNPDMVLLDLGLPDVDGQTLLGMLRRDYGMQDTPIIVCTAWPEDTAKKMAKAYGFTDFISKPYRVNNFMKVVKDNLP